MILIMLGLIVILLTGVIVIETIYCINEVKKFSNKVENYKITGEWR